MTTTTTTILGADGVRSPIEGLERHRRGDGTLRDAAMVALAAAILLLVAF
jgi:hypothetical protein